LTALVIVGIGDGGVVRRRSTAGDDDEPYKTHSTALKTGKDDRNLSVPLRNSNPTAVNMGKS
jgi:hypothetical protein